MLPLWPSAKASASHSYFIFVWMDVSTDTCTFIKSLAGFLHVSKPGQHWSLFRDRNSISEVNKVIWWHSEMMHILKTGNVSINDHCFSPRWYLDFSFPSNVSLQTDWATFSKPTLFQALNTAAVSEDRTIVSVLFHSYILGAGPSRLHPLFFTTWLMSLQARVCKQCCTCTHEYVLYFLHDGKIITFKF